MPPLTLLDHKYDSKTSSNTATHPLDNITSPLHPAMATNPLPAPVGVLSTLTPDEVQNYTKAISLVSLKGESSPNLEMDLTHEELHEFRHLTSHFVTHTADDSLQLCIKLNNKSTSFLTSLFRVLAEVPFLCRPQFPLNVKIDLALGVLRDKEFRDDEDIVDVTYCARAMGCHVLRKVVAAMVDGRRAYLARMRRRGRSWLPGQEPVPGSERVERPHERVVLYQAIDRFIWLLDEQEREGVSFDSLMVPS